MDNPANGSGSSCVFAVGAFCCGSPVKTFGSPKFLSYGAGGVLEYTCDGGIRPCARADPAVSPANAATIHTDLMPQLPVPART